MVVHLGKNPNFPGFFTPSKIPQNLEFCWQRFLSGTQFPVIPEIPGNIPDFLGMSLIPASLPRAGDTVQRVGAQGQHAPGAEPGHQPQGQQLPGEQHSRERGLGIWECAAGHGGGGRILSGGFCLGNVG